MEPQFHDGVMEQNKYIEKLITKHNQQSYTELFQHFIELIDINGYSYIVYLCAYKYMRQLLKTYTKKPQIFNKNSHNIVGLLLQAFDKYGQGDCEQFSNLEWKKAQEKLQEQGKMNNELQQLKNHIVKEWIDTLSQLKNASNTPISLIKDLRTSILNYLKSNDFGITNGYQEVTLNWFFSKLEAYRIKQLHVYPQQNHQKLTQRQDFCCKLIWKEQQIIQMPQNLKYQFKKFGRLFQANENISFTIKKFIIAYLNENGGCLFSGYDKKQIKVKQKDKDGLKLWIKPLGNPYQPNDFQKQYENLNKYVDQIFPKHEGFPSPKRKPENMQNIRNRVEIQINDYISFSFMPILSKGSFQNKRDQNGNILYLLNIIVKKGHPRHLYHTQNKDQVLEFFLRGFSEKTNESFRLVVAKIKCHDGISMLEQKITKFKKEKDQIENSINLEDQLNSEQYRPLIHPNCFFSMRVKITKIKNQWLHDNTDIKVLSSGQQSD